MLNRGGTEMIVVENLSKCIIDREVKYNYNYRMIKNIFFMLSNDKEEEFEVYGIEIERMDIKYDKVISIERDSVESISPDREKVHELLEKLCKHEVSPIHLIEIVGELVDECVVDFDNTIQFAY